jgi:hypothetical protein
MTRPFKLAIIRARHDTSVATISDQACLEMLVTGPRSVMRFWEQTTGDYFDFLDSAMLPWVDITITPTTTDRVSQATAAFAAVRARELGHDPLAGFDGAIVLTLPGRMIVPNPKMGQPGQPSTIMASFDGGSASVGELAVSVLPVMSSDHTFMCHELGHTLGFEHTFGLDNNGTDWDPTDATIIVGPEYGSPFDLMSSASFGSRWLGTSPFYSASPPFAGPAVANWPFAGATQMGPNISRANLHRWFPDALARHIVDRPFPGPGDIGYVRLQAVSSRSGTTLLVLHPPAEPASGVGRVYVEFRDTRGWDAGLQVYGSDLAQAGVAVHTLEDVAGVGPRVWYRGSVVRGSTDTDLEVATLPIVVTLEGFDDAEDDSWADISYQQSATRAITITAANASDDIIGGQVIRDERTPCDDNVKYGSWSTQSFCQFRVSTTGFAGTASAPPTITWTVAGTSLSPGQGSVNVPFDGVEFALEYVIDPISYELGLTARGGERFSVALVATAVEAGGGASSQAGATFNSLGYFDGYSPEDKDTIGRCLARIVDEHHIPMPQRFRRPDPGPMFQVDTEGWREGTLQLIHTDVHLDQETMQALEHIVQMQGQH